MNVLQKSRINPKLSAWVYLFDQFDWMAIPLAPPGTKILVRLQPDARISWSPNCEEGWTIGFLRSTIVLLKFNFQKTRSERNMDTVTFPPTVIPYPNVDLCVY